MSYPWDSAFVYGQAKGLVEAVAETLAHDEKRRRDAGEPCGFQLFGMMPPCVLIPGHSGDHSDGFGGWYSEGGFDR